MTKIFLLCLALLAAPISYADATQVVETDTLTESPAPTLVVLEAPPAAAEAVAQPQAPEWIQALLAKYPAAGLVVSLLLALLGAFRLTAEALLWFAEKTKNEKAGKVGRGLTKATEFVALCFAKVGYSYPKKLQAKTAAKLPPQG